MVAGVLLLPVAAPSQFDDPLRRQRAGWLVSLMSRRLRHAGLRRLPTFLVDFPSSFNKVLGSV